jgi:hypothetical protein
MLMSKYKSEISLNYQYILKKLKDRKVKQVLLRECISGKRSINRKGEGGQIW